AGVYYLLAASLDNDPFVMFELRGLSRDALLAELAQSPLGQVLASSLVSEEVPPAPVTSYFTRPVAAATSDMPTHKEFWTGAKRLPTLRPPVAQGNVPALLIKKQGDYPPFWHKDLSFISVMEEVYERVRTKSKQMK